MGSIRLHPSDRARYNAPEVIEFDLSAVGVRQRAALERETKKPYRWFLNQLGGVPELDEAGNPIPEPVLDEAGEPVLNPDGTPQVTAKLRQDGEAIAMLVWLALWGIGIKTPWETFEVRANGLDINGGDDSNDDPGKAGQPETDSESTTTDPN